MLAHKYKSSNNDIGIHIYEISHLFKVYKDSYRKIFQLTDSSFLAMKKLKIKRTGCLIVIKLNSHPCGFFTVSLQNNAIGEFGDLYKTSLKLSREDFASGINTGVKLALKKLSLKGVYSYQNSRALSLVHLAGFQRIKYYERHISLVVLNLIIKLPIKIIDRKTFLTLKPLLNTSPIKFNFKLAKTRLSRCQIPYLRHQKEMENSAAYPIFLGLLNEFHDTGQIGDSLMYFGDLDAYDLKTGFEYSDNSA
jgi:hypothetical protein